MHSKPLARVLANISLNSLCKQSSILLDVFGFVPYTDYKFPEDTVAMLYQCGLEYLVMGNYLIRKNPF
jgi:hypothetical protein